MSKPKVTITYVRETIPDEDADVSYLEPGGRGPGMSAEDDAADAARLAAFKRGDWYMLGVRARAKVEISRPGYTTCYEITSPGLWNVESDSGEDYLAEIFKDECAILRADIDALRDR